MLLKINCKILLLSGVAYLLASTFSWAQKEPQYTQYMYNIGSFNPAYVGSVETPEIMGLYRAQWIDIEGAPRTLRFGANVPLGNDKMGLGFNVISDELGPVSQTYIDVAYSYEVNLSDNSWLSFGIDAGGSTLKIDYSQGNFQNPNEPLLFGQEQNSFYPTIGAGLFMYSDNWYLGASIPNFLTNGIYNDEIATIVEDKIQYNFIGGYIFQIAERSKFKPAFLINYLQGAGATVNLSANFLFADAVTIGASYRLNNAVSGLAGFQISQGMFLGYSYDYNTNSLGEFNSGSHEVILKFYLGRGSNDSDKTRNREKNKKLKGKPKQIDSPRFF
ncbi:MULTISPECIES: PorP/SprF family type IX secretion system membrane protein [Croceitalea]|uniref:Type IX secretion system membrane protein PorP/SprF n=1 Tax=Croceitalea vernalis TaxID=3075599 RepID=A0ABU3BFW9_9FLAO|nr:MULTISPECIES: type IX secretion system membrane protein PorP/SprF [unclassified Croceitalea]MDT0539250.1 type IX secretion system membrane protein PorP/SprF [Croceitalea sp. P059]MDT0621044.1 type IX secretion system membrane protein PorP/SprF [Croceitalea sp. P007]